jgi:chaperone modulatory protein CbpM
MTLPATTSGRIHLEVFSSRCGLHPGLVRRFVALGLIEPIDQVDDQLWFSAAQIVRVARMQRLRSDLALNYSALGLVLDLLDRIEQLETASARDARHLRET